MGKRTIEALSKEDQALLAPYPRDFEAIPKATNYGKGKDEELNKKLEDDRLTFQQTALINSLKQAVAMRQRPIFTIALIAGDCVILDALHKAGVLNQVKVIFVDTYTLFPETLAFLHEVENHYGFKAEVYHAKGLTQAEYDTKFRPTHFDEKGRLVKVEEYDQMCKVEPLGRAMEEANTDCWINGRRRDHGADRAMLSVWEGVKLNPLAFWSFEDCWLYLQRNNVPYHPLHDAGYASLGDKHSTVKVALTKWMKYEGERSGRFVGLKNSDGSAKTECGIHNRLNPNKKQKTGDSSATAVEVKN